MDLNCYQRIFEFLHNTMFYLLDLLYLVNKIVIIFMTYFNNEFATIRLYIDLHVPN